MKKVILIALLLVVTSVQATDWSDTPLKERTKLGAVWAASCVYCVDMGRYNNDQGLWQCTNDSPNPSTGVRNQCMKKIVEALAGRFEG